MNGAGNDFVLIDNRKIGLQLSQEQIKYICDRQRGIGADGIMLLRNAGGEADLGWDFYNQDGSEGEMCGNGARCFGRYTALLTPGEQDTLSFETIAGDLSSRMIGDDVEVTMSDPFDLQLDSGVSVEGLDGPVHSLNTGVPHALSFVHDLANFDVRKVGSAIRYHSYFPNGTNANFVEELKPGHIAIRTYERGVEDETLACGTGMVACSIVYHLLKGIPAPIKVNVLGGDTLGISFEGNQDTGFRKVTLTGPADFVFEGEISL